MFNSVNSGGIFLLSLLLLFGLDIALVLCEGLPDLPGALATHVQRLVFCALQKNVIKTFVHIRQKALSHHQVYLVDILAGSKSRLQNYKKCYISRDIPK